MDGPEVQKVGLCSAQEPFAFQSGKAARHRPQQDSHRTTAVRHFDGLARGHASQDGTRLTTQLPDPDPLHVRHCSTSPGPTPLAGVLDVTERSLASRTVRL